MARPLRILVTAGNTQTPVDRVRCITNIFTGRTGGRLALEARDRGHEVTLLTSHPRVIDELRPGFTASDRWKIESYRTFDDLKTALAAQVPTQAFDVIFHAAAVSDYELAGVYTAAAGTGFDAESLRWKGSEPQLVDVGQGKVKSSHPEVWFRMTPTPKLVDLMRSPWNFQGILVKFKLEVDVSESDLIRIAHQSRQHSDADFLVANTLDTYDSLAFLVDRAGEVERLPRSELSRRLLERIETEAESRHSSR